MLLPERGRIKRKTVKRIGVQGEPRMTDGKSQETDEGEECKKEK